MHIRTSVKGLCWLTSLLVMLNGCVLLFTEGEKTIGVIPSGPENEVRFRSVLPRTSRAIRFRCAVPTSSVPGEVRVMVTLINTSKRRTISVENPGAFAQIGPHSSALIYDGGLADLLGNRGIPISTWSGRASCKLHIYFSRPLTLAEPIRVTCWHSSPPL